MFSVTFSKVSSIDPLSWSCYNNKTLYLSRIKRRINLNALFVDCSLTRYTHVCYVPPNFYSICWSLSILHNWRSLVVLQFYLGEFSSVSTCSVKAKCLDSILKRRFTAFAFVLRLHGISCMFTSRLKIFVLIYTCRRQADVSFILRHDKSKICLPACSLATN